MDEFDRISIANDIWIGCKYWLYYLKNGWEIDDTVLKYFKDAEKVAEVIGVSSDIIQRLKEGRASEAEVREAMEKAGTYADRKLLEIHAEWLEYLRLRSKYGGG